jgi:hypothetical protein
MLKKIVMSLVLFMVVLLMSGCLEVAWNSSGHIATQAPRLDTKFVKVDYSNPLPSGEVVNNAPSENQSNIIYVPIMQPFDPAIGQYPAGMQQRPKSYPVEKDEPKCMKLVTWGLSEDK